MVKKNIRTGGYDSDPIYEVLFSKEITRTFCYLISNQRIPKVEVNNIKSKILDYIDKDDDIGCVWNVRVIPECQFLDDTEFYYFTD